MKKVLIVFAVFFVLFVVISNLPDRTPLKDSAAAQAVAPEQTTMNSATENRLALAYAEMRAAGFVGIRPAGWRATRAGTCFRYTVDGAFGVQWGFVTTENVLILNSSHALELCGD